LSEQSSDDDGVRRSMARRKKSALPTDHAAQTCGECGKEFKRPCDLTKHEKTHSRPWKCTEPDCKYYEHGWPTEKERDRHVNDKHSDAPALFECQFHPCTYRSKRESNCKQHMEKTHGWTYVRSKNNGKKGQKERAIQTPQSENIVTPKSVSLDFSAPATAAPSPNDQFGQYDPSYSVGGSTSASEGIGPFSTSGVMGDSLNGFGGQYGSGESNFDFNNYQDVDFSPAMSNFAGPSFDPATMTDVSTMHTPIETSFTPVDPDLSLDDIDWSSMNHDLATWNVQLPTPSYSTESRTYDSFSRNPSVSFQPQIGQISNLSPGAQGNVMLYSPSSSNDIAADEGFEEFAGDFAKPTGDFSLFPSSGESSVNSAGNEGMFQDWSTLSGPPEQASYWRQPSGLSQFGFGDMMQLDEHQA